MTDTTANPLLNQEGLPAYGEIRAEHVTPAVRAVLDNMQREVARLGAVEHPDLGWLSDLEAVYEAVGRVWGPVAHLNAVDSSDELRAEYNACIPLITDFYTDLGQNRALYERFESLRETLPDATPVIRQIIRLGLRDFRLAGVALEGEARQRHRALMQELASKQALFEQNIMDATAAFRYHETTAANLAGLPADLLARGARAAAADGREGWLFSLDPPTYMAVMAHAENAAMREAYYRAWNTRASDQGPSAGQWNNGPLVEDILNLRYEAAVLLGFESFAAQSIASKMAGSPAEVVDFLRDLGGKSRKMARNELARLQALAAADLAPWDVGFYSEKLRQTELELAEEALRPYFALDAVLGGLFQLAERLFGIHLTEQTGVSTWHPTVRYYRIATQDGTAVGGLFADFYARATKRGGAWMDVCRNRSGLGKAQQLPVAHLVCNFNEPLDETPSLLTHSDVVTLFHEFGHAMHHLLTRVDYPSVAGINGVAWDAVELPSQFLENYAFRPEVLAEFARHYETGAPLPADKVLTLQRSRSFLAGLAMVRQLEFALFDMQVHQQQAPLDLEQVYAVLADVRAEVAVIEPPAYHRFANSFSHIFAGGYAAGYYSYKWAEVLAADAFAAFEESGIYDPATAARFRDAILAVGGSCDALEAFISFRGREPELESLLRQAGITAAASEVA